MGKEAKVKRLPTKPNKPAVKMSDFRWMVHGPPKVGKTTLGALFPSPLFWKCEEGTKGMSVYGVDIRNWEDACNIAEALKEEKHDFKTIVIDPVEQLYYYLTLQVAEENKVVDVGDLGYGKGWRECNIRIRRLLDALYSTMGVVLISHSRLIDKVFRGVKISYQVPDLSDSPRRVIVGWVDIELCLVVEDIADEDGQVIGTQRVAICQPLPEVEAGGRLRYMPDRVILPSPREGYIALQKEFEAAVEKFLAELKEGQNG